MSVRRKVATGVDPINLHASTAASRAELSARLLTRRSEIEKATLIRVHAIADPTNIGAAYLDGLRAAVTAAFDHSLAAIESGVDQIPHVPIALLAQARLAARSGVSLETVLRRYFAGYVILGDYLIEEGRSLLDDAEFKPLLRLQATVFDRLLDAVSEEYTREVQSHPGTSDQRRAARIEHLLNGEFLDISDLGYPLDGCHLGLAAAGPGAPEAIRRLCADLDCSLLIARRSEDTVWAWVGRRRSLDEGEIHRHFSESWPQGLSLAIGAPGEGLAGWRLSNHQARAALPIALRGSKPVVRYVDVSLLATALRDEVLAESLDQIFLKPLAGERDGGAALRGTLRAYFSTGGNSSSAASALGVSRQTVNSRLRVVEERIGLSLDNCAAQLKTALGLEELGG